LFGNFVETLLSDGLPKGAGCLKRLFLQPQFPQFSSIKLCFLHVPASFQRAAVEDFAPRIEQPFGTDGDVVRALIDDFHRLPHWLRQRGGERGRGAQQHGSGDTGG